MKKYKTKDFHINIGKLQSGPTNSITDVHGVKVGHTTISEGDIQTGVTAVLPHSGNLFQEKVIGSIHTINGFGKTAGSIQLEELGTIETPIILTNTLAVGAGLQGAIDYTLANNPSIGRTTGTVNAIVCECNDMIINDIRTSSVTKEHVLQAIDSATPEFEEGNIGAGTGMVCFGLKGGIGSSSRMVNLGERSFTVGVMVLTNFGKMEHLTIAGKHVGPVVKHLHPQKHQEDVRDKGSIIILVATDLPVNERQLKRVLKRTAVGLSKTGSYIGHGSGDIVLGFTTAHKILHESSTFFSSQETVQDYALDPVFEATADATEEAILNSLLSSENTKGRNNQTVYSLRSFINDIL
ncbi:D-aminopeptidase [Bacillus mesophilus]|uniref:P1 family peptidase n=1 Tax=Bacillus mesophilus TaxID=1808955 RepID=A0A6M0QDR5_9BACI|nr:P1 family peptidase [Bacillus mesophilus]MBM7663202.1 D-aminopeptidase [Bacillus mesophilus]NEY73959.1 P1 family peptidase [Bacillus mesophilus]